MLFTPQQESILEKISVFLATQGNTVTDNILVVTGLSDTNKLTLVHEACQRAKSYKELMATIQKTENSFCINYSGVTHMHTIALNNVCKEQITFVPTALHFIGTRNIETNAVTWEREPTAPRPKGDLFVIYGSENMCETLYKHSIANTVEDSLAKKMILIHDHHNVEHEYQNKIHYVQSLLDAGHFKNVIDISAQTTGSTVIPANLQSLFDQVVKAIDSNTPLNISHLIEKKQLSELAALINPKESDCVIVTESLTQAKVFNATIQQQLFGSKYPLKGDFVRTHSMIHLSPLIASIGVKRLAQIVESKSFEPVKAHKDEKYHVDVHSYSLKNYDHLHMDEEEIQAIVPDNTDWFFDKIKKHWLAGEHKDYHEARIYFSNLELAYAETMDYRAYSPNSHVAYVVSNPVLSVQKLREVYTLLTHTAIDFKFISV